MKVFICTQPRFNLWSWLTCREYREWYKWRKLDQEIEEGIMKEIEEERLAAQREVMFD